MVAKLIVSSLGKRIEEIEKILEKHELKNPHPDLFYIPDGEKLGVEQSKKIRDHFAYKPNKAKGKAVAIESADNMTPEAQNALLKTIEELPENGLFLLGANSQASFLPTILSRCQIVILARPGSTDSGVSDKPDPQNDKYLKDIEKLLESTIEERFEYIEKLKEKGEFLKALVIYFRGAFQSGIGGSRQKELVNFLNQLLTAEQWQKQNVNMRGILEYLMLVMPDSFNE